MQAQPTKTKLKQKTDWPVLGRLLRLILKTYPGWLVLALIGIVVSALAAVAGSLFLRQLIDQFIVPLTKVAHPVFTGLIEALLWMAGIFYIGVLATVLYGQIMAIIGQRVQKSIRDQLFEHMQALPVAFFDAANDGDIMSRYTNDVDTLMQLITQSFPQLISATLNWVFAFVAMLVLSPLLTALSLVIFGLSVGIVRWLTNRSHRYFKLQQRAIGQIDGYIEELLNGQKVVKVFSHEQEAEQQFDQYNQRWGQAARYANGYATMLFPIMGNVGNLLYVLVAIIGGWLAISHVTTLTLGTIAAFLQLSRSFSQPVAQISQQLNAIVQAMAGTERIFQLLDEPVETDQGKITLINVQQVDGQWQDAGSQHTGHWAWKIPNDNGQATFKPLAGAVSFEHVDFGYQPDQLILHDITFDAVSGTAVAIVGETGAGKTTMINLLSRFYEIQHGTIKYDGLNVQQIAKPDLRRALAIILQETSLFTGTIADNIRYGRLAASDAEVQQAAKLANAAPFIEQLPQQYQTVITGDGSDLSQGQRQLLAIARAAVVDPPVMILDEATANIDTQTERQIQTGMANLMHGRTTIAIAHRLSTIDQADLILVLDHGRIVEKGNHDQLMAQKGRYYQLYTGLLTLQ